MIISKTPLRVSFVGGGTDLPSFYKNNDYGAVLSTSIDKYIYVTIREHGQMFDEKIRLNYSETELIDDIEDIKNPIIREALKFLNIDEKLYISTIADIPGSSGLGSSSAFCVGLLNALYYYKGEKVSRMRLAEEAAHIEINLLNRPMGKQDHYGAAIGGLNSIQFNADESINIRPVFLDHDQTSLFFDNLITFWTGVTRSADSVLKEQNDNKDKNQETLIKMRDQVNSLYDILTGDNFNLKSLGKEIHKNWEMKQSLASNITNPTINDAYNKAMELGAHGGKLSGAGNGGFISFFAEADKHQAIKNALERMGMKSIKFNLDPSGATVHKID